MNTLDRLHAWAVSQPALRVFTLIVRVVLALAFVPAGLVKIMGEPFTTLPESDPVGHFFGGFFSAHGYYQFVGVAQWMAGGLLLIPRTATLGAVLYLPIIVNIFAITMAIGPAFAFTRVITGLMLLADIYLLLWDWDRWKALLPLVAPPEKRHGDLTIAPGLIAAAGIGFQGVVGTHMARLRHGSFVGPLVMVGVGTLLGLAMLAAAYRRARSAA